MPSSSSKTQISFRPEVTPGVFDPGPLQALPVRSESFEQASQIFRNDSLTGRRSQQRGIIVGRSKKGQTPFYLDPNPIFHPLISAMMSAVPTPSATVAAADISFSSSDNSVNSAAGAFTAVAGQRVFILGSTQSENNGLKKVVTATAQKLTFAEAIVDEAAGAAITVKTTKMWRNGDVIRYQTFQRSWTDQAPVVHDHFPGMAVNSASLSYQQGGNPVGLDLDLMGLGQKHVAGDPLPTGLSNASLDVVTPAPPPEMISAAISVRAIFQSGALATAKCSRFDIGVAQNIQEFGALGWLGAAELILGDFVPSGTFEVLFENMAQLEAVRANALDEFAIAVQDKLNRLLIVDIPAAELESGEPQSGGRNNLLTLPMGYTGVDSSLGHAMQTEYLEL
ncbi:MAG: hypothetical protein K0U98_11335 [Deltaproteobacteria bacterium]|nr:hypothetical protein [Deltaproteobacteria bacterium]